eukprot:509571_1
MIKLKNMLNNLKITQSQINEKKIKITKDINNTFENLILELKNRQKELLLEVNNIMNSKNKIVNNNINIINNNMKIYKQQKQKCDEMIRKRIELNEVKERKIQIIKIKNNIINFFFLT